MHEHFTHRNEQRHTWRCLLGGALVALLLVGCSNPAARVAPGPAAGQARGTALFDPGIGGITSDASLRVNLDVQQPGLATHALPNTFDHAVAHLTGPLLDVPRTMTIPVGGFSLTPGAIGTVAGNGSPGFLDGAGTAARFNFPRAVAVDKSGNVYVADRNNHSIRKLDPAGNVTTVAGDGSPGYVDGTGSGARFDDPIGVAVDGGGNIYVADRDNQRIRKVAPDGVVTTLAGDGTAGSLDGTGTDARFDLFAPGPVAGGLAVGPGGDLFVADTGNHRIRRVTPAGVVTTVAGSSAGFANGTGTAAQFKRPRGVAADPAGNLYVADAGNQRIRRIAADGTVSTLAGDGTAGLVNGGAASARFDEPMALAVDNSGVGYVVDANNNRIRRVGIDGTVSTLAGDGTTGILDFPAGIALDPARNLYVADFASHRIRKLIVPVNKATGTFQNLRPGAGYQLAVSLFDAPAPGGQVAASGQTNPFAIPAGTSQVNVILDLTATVRLPLPLPLTFSFSFDNNTANAAGQPVGAVVVAGDVFQIKPGVSDPNNLVGEVQLFLDGTAAASFSDGQLLATWYRDALATVLSWNTGAPHAPLAFGTPPSPPPSPSPNPFFSPPPAPSPLPSPGAVPPPSAVAAEGTPNHTLSFLLYDRRAGADKYLIRVKTYNLTVVDPADLTVGIQ